MFLRKSEPIGVVTGSSPAMSQVPSASPSAVQAVHQNNENSLPIALIMIAIGLCVMILAQVRLWWYCFRKLGREKYNIPYKRKSRLGRLIEDITLNRDPRYKRKHEPVHFYDLFDNDGHVIALVSLFLFGVLLLLGGLLNLPRIESARFVVVGTIAAAVVFGVILVSVIIARSRRPENIRHATTQEADNVFQDFSQPLIRMVVTGTAQVTLMVMYFSGVATKEIPDFSQPMTYIFYALGMLLTIAYFVGKNMSHTIWKTSIFWLTVMTSAEHGIELTFNDEDFHPKRCRVWIRMIFDILINIVGVRCILALVPMQVAGDDYLDFVLNIMAAYFIVELDDLGGDHQFVLAVRNTVTLRSLASGVLQESTV